MLNSYPMQQRISKKIQKIYFKYRRRLFLFSPVLLIAFLTYRFFVVIENSRPHVTTGIVTDNIDPSNPLFKTYAGLLVGMVNTNDELTIFAPSDSSLLQISSIFRKFEKKEDKIMDILEDLIGYLTIPGAISTKMIKKKDFMREESLNGYGIMLKHDKSNYFVNGITLIQMNVKVNKSFVHIVDGLIGPLELEQRIAVADPSDLDPITASHVAKNVRKKRRPKKVAQNSDDEDYEEGKEGGLDEQKAQALEFEKNWKGIAFEEEPNSDERNMDPKVKGGNGFLETNGKGKEKNVGLVGKVQVIRKENSTKSNETLIEEGEDDDEYDDEDEDEDEEEEEEDDEAIKAKHRNEGEQVLGANITVKSQIDPGSGLFSWVSSYAKVKASPNTEGKGRNLTEGKMELRGSHKDMISETPTRPQVFCSGRGRMLEDGYCECSPLFHGKDCDKPREVGNLGIEPYADDLIVSREILFDELFELDHMVKQNLSQSGLVLRGKGQLANFVTELSPAQRVELKRGLPPYDPLESRFWDSCAVVGSSSSLLIQELGEEIDSHEIVIRFNGAPTYGYEKQVGKKTSIRISNVEYAGFREGNETVIYSVWPRNKKEEVLRLLKFKRMFPQEPLLVLELGFVNSVFTASGFLPSVGYIGWSFALQKCRRVNLYGFYIGTEQGMKHHYYSVQTVSKGTKEIEREFVAAIDVSESEFIWFAESCLFDCRRSLQRCSMCLRIPLATLVERAMWTKEQIELNKLRDERWLNFLKWEQVEQRRGRVASIRKRYDRTKRRPRKRVKSGKKPSLLEEWSEEWEVPWDKIILEGHLGELSLRELMLYFRQFHIAIPPTRIEMMRAIRSHYFFMHRDLSRHVSKLYRVSDAFLLVGT